MSLIRIISDVEISKIIFQLIFDAFSSLSFLLPFSNTVNRLCYSVFCFDFNCLNTLKQKYTHNNWIITVPYPILTTFLLHHWKKIHISCQDSVWRVNTYLRFEMFAKYCLFILHSPHTDKYIRMWFIYGHHVIHWIQWCVPMLTMCVQSVHS